MVFTYLGAFFEEVLLIHAGSQLLKSSISAENGCILFEKCLKSGRVGKTKSMGGRGEKTGETSYITGVAKCGGYIFMKDMCTVIKCISTVKKCICLKRYTPFMRYEHGNRVHQHSKIVHMSETKYSVYEI